MSNEEFEQFREYVKNQSKNARGEINYPTMSGYLMGMIADLAMEFPQVAYRLMDRVSKEQAVDSNNTR